MFYLDTLRANKKLAVNTTEIEVEQDDIHLIPTDDEENKAEEKVQAEPKKEQKEENQISRVQGHQ